MSTIIASEHGQEVTMTVKFQFYMSTIIAKAHALLHLQLPTNFNST